MSDRPILLLAVPRSVSTAFDRMLRERGDLDVRTEPFSRAYYDGPERVSAKDPGEWADDSFTFGAVLADVLAPADRRVAVKDMAHQLGPLLTVETLAHFDVSFLTRDPARAVPSLFRMGPESTEEETGYAGQHRAIDLVAELNGRRPPVVDAADLRADPPGVVAAWCDAVGLRFDPGALSWEPGPVPGWERWREWFARAESSTGFAPPETGEPAVPAELADLVERCRTHYEHVLANGDRVT